MKILFSKILFVVLVGFALNANAATYTVTKTADTNDGSCSATDCSLREAIVAANASTATPHTISFVIPSTDTGCASGVCTISPTSAMTSLTRGSITINGYSQTGASANTATYPAALNGTLTIVLKGSSAPSTSKGLTLASSNNVIKGLVVKNFGSYGIYISTGTGNKIQGCYVGVESTGETKAANTGANIYVAGSSHLIGTDGDGSDDAAERNLISGSASNGITLASNSNRVAGNFIGTDKDGDTDLGNTLYGIFISLDSNTIGTNSDGSADDIEGNVIAGNDSYGIYLGSSADGNIIAGNAIGTNAAETAALANKNGIYVAGNTTKIGVNTDGSSGADEGNVISGNTTTGIHINAGTGNVIAGNKIGTDGSGLVAIANRTYGVSIAKGPNRVGTDGDGVNDDAEGNIISGNTSFGIYISSSAATGNTIAGNVIGLGADLATDLGNGSHGIYLYNGTINNTIGGDSEVEMNTIVNNGDATTEYGIYLYAGTTDANQILRNKIYQNHGTEIKLYTGANNDKAAPTITTDSSGAVSGTATAGDTVLVFDASSDGGAEAYVGQATADATGAWSLTLDSAYNTNGNTLTATATDATNGTSQLATSYTIANAASAPVADNATASTNEDTAITLALSATDTDSTTLTYAIAANPTHGTLSTPSATGSVTYTPTADYEGPDSFTFTASDGALTSNAGTVTITINAVADAPSVPSPPTATLDEDTLTNIALTATDPDSTTLTYSIATSPTHGTITTPSTSGAVTYTPTADYNGSDSFTYSVSDGALSTTATATITVTPVDEPNATPTAGNVTVYAADDLSATFSLAGADADTDDTLTYSYAGTSALSGTLTGTAPDLTYTPAGIVRSGESFTYTVTDPDGATATGTVTIAPAAEAIHIGAGGFLTRLHQDPTDSESCWATSDVGGIFLSEDGCQTFTPKNASFWRGDHYSVDDIAVDLENGDTVYALSGNYTSTSNYADSLGYGLWKSTDRGDSWEPLLRRRDGACDYYSSTATNGFVTTCSNGGTYIRQDGRKEEELYSTSFASSDDYGIRQMADGKRIAFDPSSCSTGSCQTIYVADFKKGVYKSLDGGSNFSQLPLPAITAYNSSVRVSSINLVPYTSGGVTEYLILVGARYYHSSSATFTSTAYKNGALYLGFNGGESPNDWVTISLPSTKLSDIRDIALDPDIDLGTVDANDVIHLATGKMGIVKGEFTAVNAATPSATMSFSYGSNCSVSASGSYGSGLDLDSTCDLSVDSGTYVAVEVDPDDPNNLYAAMLAQGDGQVYHSVDGGVTWTGVLDDPESSSLSDYANFDYNGIWFNQHYWKIASYAATLAFTNRDNDGSTSSGGSSIAFSDFWSMWKSPNDGSDSFTAYYEGIENVVFADMASDPFNSERLYLGVLDHAFFTSEDGGETVTLRGAGGSTPYPSSSGITGGQGYGAAVATSSTEAAAGGYANAVFFATNNNTTAGGSIYESSDGGETFSNIGTSTSLPVGFVKAIAYDETNERLYVTLNSSSSYSNSNGTGHEDYSGLYCLQKSGGSWSTATEIGDFTATIGASSGDTVFSNDPQLVYHAASGKLFVMHNSSTAAYRLLYTYTPGTTCSNGTYTQIATSTILDSTSRAKLQAVAVDPADANVIYVGTYRQGLWYTADGGSTWTQYFFDPSSTSPSSRSSTYFNRSISDIKIHPSDSDVIVLGGLTDYFDASSGSYYGNKTDVMAANQVYYSSGVVVFNKSTNAYTDVSSAIAPFGRDVTTLALDANDPYRVLVGTGGQGGMRLHLDNLIDWSGTALE